MDIDIVLEKTSQGGTREWRCHGFGGGSRLLIHRLFWRVMNSIWGYF